MNDLQKILKEFHEIAASPQEQVKKYLAQNKQIIACAPIYTPEEIIHSMGMIPFGTWGGDIEIKEAKAYFPSFICSIMQSILELGMTGVYDGISAIVIPSLCDSLKCLGQNWKYAVPEIKFIPMVYPQNRNTEYGKEFTKSSYERVISELETITGQAFDEEKLKQSIVIYNYHNLVMRQFADCVGEYSVISASERSDIFKSAYFMEKSEHTELVKKLLMELQKTQRNDEARKVDNKNVSDEEIVNRENTTEKENITDRENTTEDVRLIRIITSGILADSKDLLAIFEENKMQIVADDIANESRQYRVDCKETESALNSLAEKFANMNNCSVLYDADKGRAQFVVDLAKKNKADGVIMVMTKFCDPEEFDYVIIKNKCEEEEIPILLIEIDRQMVNYEQVRTAVQTFSEMLG